ncbi:response regulator transcription factor [Aggregicoccus sp. 17bor-14]|nr:MULTISPECIES: response regulator transcription factor [Myxococcaceae]MBF5046246.1 response regulator transcription factor [Simulacricoccus sp. 17bor-14]MRI91969.1 response regulator transcription factor [Aggregicoccus sp. 17bor-14]
MHDDATLELHIALLAEDPLVRGALARALSDAGAPRVTPGSSVGELETALAESAPDALLWDAGLHAAGPLEAPEVGGAPVLALVPDEAVAERALEAGARGLLPRDASAAQLLAGLTALAHGLLVFEPSLAPLRSSTPHRTVPEALTPREREVLQLLAEGASNKDIAQRLAISEHTAKFHVNAVLAKLGVQRRTEAVVRAARLGWVTL